MAFSFQDFANFLNEMPGNAPAPLFMMAQSPAAAAAGGLLNGTATQVSLGKFNKDEFSLSYAKQVEVMTKGFEHFVKGIKTADQMEKRAKPTGIGLRKSRSLDALFSPNPKWDCTKIAKSKAEPEAGPSVKVKEEVGSDVTDGCSTSASASLPSPLTAPDAACRCDAEALKKRLDTMCSFLHTIFLNQMEIVGKNYQAQMETMKKVEDVQLLVEEEFDMELEAIQADFAQMKSITIKNLQNRMSTLEQGFMSMQQYLKESAQTIDLVAQTLHSISDKMGIPLPGHTPRTMKATDALRTLTVEEPTPSTSASSGVIKPSNDNSTNNKTGAKMFKPSEASASASEEDEEYESLPDVSLFESDAEPELNLALAASESSNNNDTSLPLNGDSGNDHDHEQDEGDSDDDDENYDYEPEHDYIGSDSSEEDIFFPVII